MSLLYDAKEEVVTLAGVEILLNASTLLGGRRIQVSELFKSDEYSTSDLGGKQKKIDIKFTLTRTQSKIGLFERKQRLSRELSKNGTKLFVHPQLGKLDVVNGEFSFSIFEYYIEGSVSLIIVPPKKSLLGIDYLSSIARKATEVIDSAKKVLNSIEQEIASGERLLGEIQQATVAVEESFSRAKYILSDQSLAQKKIASLSNNLKAITSDIAESFVTLLQVEETADVEQQNSIAKYCFVPTAPSDSEFESITYALAGVVILQEVTNRKKTTKLEILATDRDIKTIEAYIAHNTAPDLLASFKKMRAEFEKMIVDDVFGVAAQKIIPPSNLPVVASLYNVKGSENLVKQLQELEENNTRIDHLFGNSDRELLVV